jgi:hypothetical protein
VGVFFERSERKRMNPYVAITVGALALVGAVSIVKSAKSMVRCGCEKMKKIMRWDVCEQ